MDSNLIQVCRLCLETTSHLLNIFESFQNSTIASILTQHYWFQVNESDGLSEWICEKCWISTKTFHIFYNGVRLRHANYLNSIIKSAVADGAELLKQERSDSPSYTALEPVLDIIVKREEIEPCSEVIDMQICKLENSDSNGDQSETLDDGNVTENQTKTRTSEKKKQDAQIREFFIMECDICSNVKFETLIGARQHYRKAHKTDGYLLCCGRKFHTRPVLLKHIHQHMKTNASNVQLRYNTHSQSEKDKQDAQIREFFTMECDICSDVKFETLIRARQHYRKVHKIDGYLRCCDKKYHRRFALLEHMLRHTNPDAHHCDMCDKSFSNKRSLKNHFQYHVPVDSRPHKYKCSICASKFPHAWKLNTHIKRQHPDKDEEFPCDECKKSFRSRHLLSCHIRHMHQSSLDFVCDFCANRFKTKTLLRYHIASKHSTTPQPKFQCDICGAWVKRKSYLKRHFQEQHQDRNVVNCPICNKQSVNKKSLYQHISYVHSDKSHLKCVLCDKTFKSPKNLKEHTATHTGEDLYHCAYCDKKFKSNANMYSHRKKAHLAEWSRDIFLRQSLEPESTNTSTY